MILGIDIGGTAVKMGLVDKDGVIHARHEASVCFDGYKTPILTTVIREAKAFLAARKVCIEGIGVSATGQVDDRIGAVIGTNGSIPNYEGAQIKRDMESEFGVPVFVLNDANAAVLGECFMGRAKGMKNVLMLTLGTGVGGGVVLDGKVLGGTRGIAGEMGHFTLCHGGRKCACGRSGCFEVYASVTALVRLAEAQTAQEGLSGRIIFGRAESGDEQMLSVIDRWTDDIAAGISGLVHIFNPEAVLIGGGVSAQEKLLIEPLREKVLSSVMPRFAEGLRIEAAALGNDAGLMGAVKFFVDKCKKQTDA